MRKNAQKYQSTFIILSILTLTSCLSNKTVIRNYPFFTQESCDCIMSHPLIIIGSTSNYLSKEKAICTRSNYVTRRDSIYLLKNEKYQFEVDSNYIDSLNQKTTHIDSLINDLKKDWTHIIIKTKWKGFGDSSEVVILKQKIEYFNRFKPFRKHIGKEKFKNGTLIKSNMKNRYSNK